ncbi:MAG: hypothetical protein M3O84_01810, partial [Actinomycetota bacterium]|nr:hypothetical protein [Actinomycetota bacterium]
MRAMLSARNILALGRFLFDTTFMWMTKEFLAQGQRVDLCVVGLLAVLPYAVGIHSLDGFGDAGVLMNIAIHSLGSAVVLLLV